MIRTVYSPLEIFRPLSKAFGTVRKERKKRVMMMNQLSHLVNKGAAFHFFSPV
jgi:hypothetical protein